MENRRNGFSVFSKIDAAQTKKRRRELEDISFCRELIAREFWLLKIQVLEKTF
jgi:hypothetical protein